MYSNIFMYCLYIPGYTSLSGVLVCPGPVFMKGLSQGLGLKLKGSALRLVSSGLKFFKEDLNMATINFPPLQKLKWL